MPSANVSRYAGSWLKYRLTSGYVAAIYPRAASAIPIMAASVAAGCRRNARASSGENQIELHFQRQRPQRTAEVGGVIGIVGEHLRIGSGGSPRRAA